MSLKTQATPRSGTDPTSPDPSLALRLGVCCPGGISNERGFGPANAEDQITFKRWRFGFLAFYCAIITLLGGLAAAVDRPATLISASAQANPAAVATGSVQHTAERRMRE